MCFSAGVSFGAGALLVGAGVVAIKKIESPKKLAFASIPFLFGLQQISEGVLWLTFNNSELEFWHKPSIYSFLLFAKVIWPIWIPYAIWAMEPDKAKKKILYYLIFIGAVSAAQLVYCIFAYGVSAHEEAMHIKYNFHIPHLTLHRIFYIPPMALPFFISSLKLMKPLGAALVSSLILAIIFFYYHVISMWCFFAAILSVLVIVIIMRNKESSNEENVFQNSL